MANLAMDPMGAMGRLIPKLYQLVENEYKLQAGVKERIRFLTQEFEHVQAALRKVAEVPWDQLDQEVKLWAFRVREMAYEMELDLDYFLVRDQEDPSERILLKYIEGMINLLKTRKGWRKIIGDVKEIKARLQEVTERRRRYAVDDIMAKPVTLSTFHPRLDAMSNKVMRNLVGIDESSDEFIYMLQSPRRDDASNTKVKIVSLVGVDGLGKTTLAKAVYDKLKGDFDCGAFVHVDRNPDLNKVFKDILIHLDRQRYLQTVLDTRQLIDELRSFLANKRYLLVIDDIWDIESWETIKLVIDDDHNCGGRVIITTRKWEVATKADEVYKLRPLPYKIGMMDLRGAKTQEAEKVESALRPLVQSHANRPTLTLERVGTCVDHDKILSLKLDHYSPVTPGVMPLELLREITNNFSEEQILGSGIFGTVYMGVQDNGREVAVKLLHPRLQRLDYEEEFKEELEKLRRLNHPNIAQLLGYCYEVKDKCVEYNGRLIVAEEIYRALCFEFMHHGSLQWHLEDESHGLDWQTRYTIIKGTCEGLKYLHEGLESPMYHLDLKPSNILLDRNMVPKLADFGLSKLVCDNEDQSTLSFLGPAIYCPPEYIEQKYVSNKLDIFSLGVIMIQIIAGSGAYYETAKMPPKEFIHHVEENWRKRLQEKPGCTLLKHECHQVKRCIEIAMDCIQADRRKRPNIGDVTSWLSETEISAITFTSQNDDDDKADGEDEIKFFGTEQTDFTDQEGEMRCTLSVIEAPTGSSLGATGPLLRKLDSLLSSKNQLRRSVNEAIKLLRADLEEIVADLLRLSMVERPNYKIRYWMHEVRELSYHIEDRIDNMMRSRTTAKAKMRISGRRPQFRVRRVVIPWLPKTVLPSEWIAELRTLLWEASERHERYHLQDCVSEPTSFLCSGNSKVPASSGAAASLIGVDITRGKLTSWLSIDQTEAEQQQLKVLSILGPSGVGKTALVRELYRELGNQFECLAFVRVSRNPDIERLLGEILSQLQGLKRDYNACTVDNLLDTIRSHLQDKRYFVVIDELWEAAVWDIINIAFPKGNNCSRIIITAEGKDVKCYCVDTLEMTPLGNLQDSGKIFFDEFLALNISVTVLIN